MGRGIFFAHTAPAHGLYGHFLCDMGSRTGHMCDGLTRAVRASHGIWRVLRGLLFCYFAVLSCAFGMGCGMRLYQGTGFSLLFPPLE